VELRVGTGSGDRTVRQTKSYFPYQPGKSQLVIITFIGGDPKANLRRRVGYFDEANGVFLEQTGDGLFIVLRSSTSGAVVDRRVSKSDWNNDAMDGNGVSGVTLDITKAQILLIDMEWLGVGRVRCGFVVDGKVYYFHNFTWANTDDATTVYMSTATLPVRYEVENTGATASSSVLKQICSTVASEGGFDISRGRAHAASNGITVVSVGGRRPILSIRPALTHGGQVNHTTVLPDNISFHNQTQSLFYEIVYDGSLDTPAWTPVDGDSVVEQDVASTVITGGTVIASGYVVGAAGAQSASKGVAGQELRNQYPLTVTFDGSNSYPLSIVGTALSSTASTLASMEWIEIT
jgi:hypothetical protein